MLVNLLILGLLIHNVLASPKVLEDYERLLVKIKDKFKELKIASDSSGPLSDPQDYETNIRSGRFSIPPINRLTTAHPIKLSNRAKVRKTANLFSPFLPVTTPNSPLNYSVRSMAPMESKLRIQKLNNNKVIISSEGDEEGPFIHDPKMFDDISTSTSMPIITTTAVMVPMFMLDTETAEEINGTLTSTMSSDDMEFTEPMKSSTIIDNARFSFLETPIMDPLRRRRYRPRRPRYDSLEDYDDEDFIPRRRKFLRPPAYYDDYDMPRFGRRRYRYSKYRPIAAAAPLSLEEDSREFESPHAKNKLRSFKSGTAGSKTFEPEDPLPLSTLLQASQVKEGAGLADSKHGYIPSPSKEGSRSAPPPEPKKSLQMSAENCRKVNSYAKIFGVTNPQKWVRHNCAFVQTFVKAPCKDINSFVDSCYKKNG
ncbi:unnamed protein product [Bursaphelenchus xylophilus]|uniref:(pine wood nematode) hypothetical protein n=1 Tax=Bursaphelenchus xylophilus TaxID=6326 RepID=A0A1I7RHE7_BURXY|nr:unnamed protein product [Bursaphelenchus xylophilus]CAG9115807.1 unnamed protein product [Bursaphelenchus xylophilus]